MNDTDIIGEINGYLHSCATILEKWLASMLPRVSDHWWQECVLDKLSYNQRMIVEEKNLSKLSEFDLAALLRIADRNWYAMREFAYLPTKERECIREMVVVRNRWAHCAGELPDNESIKRDIGTLIMFMEQRGGSADTVQKLHEFSIKLDRLTRMTLTSREVSKTTDAIKYSGEIKEKSMVCMVSQPDVKGIVLSVEAVGSMQKYDVFMEGAIKTFYTGQIKLANAAPSYPCRDVSRYFRYPLFGSAR